MGKPELEGEYSIVARMWPDYSVEHIARHLGWLRKGKWDCRRVWNAKATIDRLTREAAKE